MYFILFFVDDESSEDEMENNDEIDLHDEDDSEEGHEVAADNIGYDSEENEVEYLEEDKSKII